MATEHNIITVMVKLAGKIAMLRSETSQPITEIMCKFGRELEVAENRIRLHIFFARLAQLRSLWQAPPTRAPFIAFLFNQTPFGSLTGRPERQPAGNIVPFKNRISMVKSQGSRILRNPPLTFCFFAGFVIVLVGKM